MNRDVLIVSMLILGTLVTRFLPFLLFPAGKKTPEFVTYLGKTLPYASIGLLVVYCLRELDVVHSPHGLPEIIAVAVVAGLHWWRRNSLLSIGVGTILYMVLVQQFF